MNYLRFVSLLGALGGCASWAVSAFWLGNKPHFSVPVDSVLSTLLGAGAGVIYVFLIANTARDDRPRLVALALLAGFFWEPVLKAGSALIDKQKDETRIAEAHASVQDALALARNLSTAPADDKALLAEEIQTKVDRASALAAEIQSVAGVQQVSEATADLAAQLEEVAPPPPLDPRAADVRAIARDPVRSQTDRVERALRHLPHL